MKYLTLALVFCAGYAAAQYADVFAADPKPVPPIVTQQGPQNPNIDIDGYLKVARSAAEHRASRRLTEEEFIKMSKEEGVIILDARSKAKFDLLHIKGAINLSFPDIDVGSLKQVLPDKNAKILIYCNNNFVNTPVPPGAQVPAQVRRAPEAFPSKLPAASLNISTYVALYNYGYRNVYELGPVVDPAKSKLTFETNVK